MLYGLTMFENDDIDFYFEENNPNNPDEYATPDGYTSYEKAEKVVKIKDAPDTIFTVRRSRHGYIMNDLIQKTSDVDQWQCNGYIYKVRQQDS